VGDAVRGGKGAHLPDNVFRKNPVYKGVLAGWSSMTELRAMNDYFSPGSIFCPVTEAVLGVQVVEGDVEQRSHQFDRKFAGA
jgi:hypothetical protein